MIDALLWSFDVLLALTLVGLAARALTTPDIFKAVVLFIVFGLLMAVAWTRLDASDIALAEAAIGAGLTGALLLNVLRYAHDVEPSRVTGEQEASEEREASPAWYRAPLVVLLAALWLVLLAVVWQLPWEADGLAVHVDEQLERSGVGNPVTAVLLNFRGYDTLLEVGVLLLAAIGVWSLGAPPPGAARVVAPPNPVLLALVRILVPVTILVAAYLLWIGTREPGGAFQAGAVLCAGGVLLLVSERMAPPTLTGWPQRALLVLGFAGFLAVALAVMGEGRRFLEYPLAWAGQLILLVEILVALSVAVILVLLFAGGPPEPTSGGADRRAKGDPT